MTNFSKLKQASALPAGVELFTPERCTAILNNPKNAHNRPLVGLKVERFAADMKSKSWKLNGQTIIFGRDPERLLTGFHRMTACVRAGVPFLSYVAYGIEESTKPTMDTGTSQSAADVLAFQHEARPKELVVVLAGLNHYRCQRFSKNSKGPSLPLEHGLRASNDDYVALLEKHPKVRNSLDFVHTAAGRGISKLISRTTAAVVHYLAAEIAGNSEVAEYWSYSLMRGEELRANSPIYRAREMLLKPSLPTYSARLYTLIDSYNRGVNGQQGLPSIAKSFISLIGAPPEAL